MAEHDGKVIFDLEIDTSKARSDLNRALSAIKNSAGSTKIKVDADTGGAVTQLGRVKSAANELTNTHPTVDVHAETGAANTQLTNTRDLAVEVGKADPNVEVRAETREADNQLTRTRGLESDIEASDPTVKVRAETGAADANLTRTRGIATDLETADPNVTVKAVTDAADTNLEHTIGLAHDLEVSDPTVNVTANTSDAESAINRVKEGALQGVGQSIGNAAIGAARTAISSVFSSGLGYDYGLAKVGTLTPEGADLDALGGRLVDLAVDMGADINTMLEAAYNGLSASVEFGPNGDNLLNYLETASKLAIGGYTDVNTAGDALSSVYNAYNGKISNDQIANLMLRTQNKGKITVGEIAQSVAQITPAASTSGVGFDQASAMWAALTASGVQSSQAATQIRTLFNELNTAGSKGEQAMRAAMGEYADGQYAGMSLSQIMDAGGDMVEVLDSIQQYASKSGLELTNFFGSSDAAAAVALLTGDNLDRFRESLDYMREEGDVVEEAYAQMADTTKMSLERVKAQFSGYAVQMFDAFGPVLDKFAEVLNSDKFKAAFGGIVDKIAGFMSGDFVERAADALVNLINWILDLLQDPWGTISAGITGALETAWDWLMGKAGELGEWIKTSIATALEGLDLPDWAKRLLGIGGGDNGGGVSGGATYTNPWGGTVTLPPSEWSGTKAANTKRGGAGRFTESAEAIDASMDEAKSAVDGAKESADAMAEAQVQTAEATAQTAASSETVAQNEANTATATASAAKSAANSAARAQRLASGMNSLNLKTSTAASAMDQVAGAITRLVNAVNNAASRAGAVVTPPSATKYAVGLDRVPYDNYPALLHKGEMVLTAAQASAYRFTGSAGGGGGIDAGALASAMSGLAVEMDGRVVGRLVERSVSAQQAVRLNRTQYGRG